VNAIAHNDPAHVDAPVPWHYGDPLREQRLIRSDTVACDLSHFGVIAVTGVDRLSWMHTLTTAYIDDSVTSLQSLILSPNGHIEHDIHLISHEDTVWLIVEPGTVDELIGHLKKMQFMLRVEVQDRTADVAVVGVSGHYESQLPTWYSPEIFRVDTPSTDKYVEARPADFQISQVLVPRSELAKFLSQFPLVGTWAWEANRIRAGVPRLGFEIDHRTIAHEVGLIGAAVHLNKGCYRGQETVARVYNLGRPPRRLVALEIDGSTNELPEPGTPIYFADKEVGVLASSTQHFEDGPIGLALIKRQVPIDAILRVGKIAASQTQIVA
jgi:folate-binding protein YgfZ